MITVFNAVRVQLKCNLILAGGTHIYMHKLLLTSRQPS